MLFGNCEEHSTINDFSTNSTDNFALQNDISGFESVDPTQQRQPFVGVSEFQFYEGNPRWPAQDGSIDVDYAIGDLGGLNGISLEDAKTAIREAFGLWSSAAPINFTEVPNGSSEAEITLDTTFLGDSNAAGAAGFEGIVDDSGVVLTDGNIVFDNSANWNIGQFLEVATHEIGHTLGLDHEEDEDDGGADAIMNTVVKNRFSGLGSGFLLEDDINGIQSLYGAREDSGDVVADRSVEPTAESEPDETPVPQPEETSEPQAENTFEPQSEETSEEIPDPQPEETSEPQAENTFEPQSEETSEEIPDPQPEETSGPQVENIPDPQPEETLDPQAENIPEETPDPEPDSSTFGSTDGNDVLIGDDQPNVIKGLGGDDYIEGRLGLDTIDGGDGVDTVSYNYGSYGFDYDLDTDRLSFQAGGTENITNIENVIGSQGNDRMTGNSVDNYFEGSGGADTFAFKSLDGSTDTIGDFSAEQGDLIEISRSGFGSGEVSYDSNSGSLSYEGQEFAILENKPAFDPTQSVTFSA